MQNWQLFRKSDTFRLLRTHRAIVPK